MASLVEECAEKMERKLRLTEEEDEGVLLVEEEEVSVETGKMCLMGKIWAVRYIGRDVVSETMGVAWDLRDRFKCKAMGDNIFVFQFRSKLDLLKAKNGGPWHVDNNLLVLEQFDGNLRPSEYKFNKTSFWIQVLDPPQKYMSLRCAESIGNRCGRFVEWDEGGDNIIWGRRLRIRVEVDILKPLMRGMNLRSLEGNVAWVNFRYEKLPTYCQWCGRLGHRLLECIHKLQVLEEEGKGSPNYMEDLRATVSKGRYPKRSQSPEKHSTSQESTANPVARDSSTKIPQGKAKIAEVGLEPVTVASDDNQIQLITPSNLINVPINLGYSKGREDIQILNSRDSRVSDAGDSGDNNSLLGSHNIVGPGHTVLKETKMKRGKLNRNGQGPKGYRKSSSPRKKNLSSTQGPCGSILGKRKAQNEEMTGSSPLRKRAFDNADDCCIDFCPTVVAKQPRREH